MSRRSSSRRPTKKIASLPEGVVLGLSSLVEGNEALIASMMTITLPPPPPPVSEAATKEEDNDDDDSSQDQSSNNERDKKILLNALTDVMAVNNLSAEALLARFFDSSVLKRYCEQRLKVSGKGNEATLAARIATRWSKPSFEALPMVITKQKDGVNKRSRREEGDDRKKMGKMKNDDGPVAKKKREQIKEYSGQTEQRSGP